MQHARQLHASSPTARHAPAGNDSGNDALRWVARFGYAARGVVYLLLGGLVLWTTFYGTTAPSPTDALATLVEAPLGRIALYGVAVGLVAFAIWRTIEPIRDLDHRGSDAKGLAVRGAHLISALINLSLAWTAFMIARATAASVQGGGSEDRVAMLMQQPWGRWLVGIVGLLVIGAAIAQIAKGAKAKFMRYVEASRSELGAWFGWCRFGLVARGIVLGVIGALLLQAAIQVEPSEAGGIADAFRAILEQPFGVFLLATVGVGLLGFAIYCFVLARYRKILNH